MRKPFPPQETHIVTVTLILPAHQAQALAQFAARAGLEDYFAQARDRREALQMHAAGQTLREELARAGYAPRRLRAALMRIPIPLDWRGCGTVASQSRPSPAGGLRPALTAWRRRRVCRS